MSTRCQIGIYENGKAKFKEFYALLYRHSDGYPGTIDGKKWGVLTDVVPFLRWWKTQRGISDLEYTSARLLQYLCNTYDGHGNGTENLLSKNTDYTGVYGHGICKYFHWDIEYFYKIYPDTLEVYDIHFRSFPGLDASDDEEINFEMWKLIKTINL